jgi:Arc/MetJ-type ribon-helix-helix transcriptional regulator
MTKNILVCVRLDASMDQQVSRALGPRYRTRSRFIRAAIQLLLAKEEANSRLQAAQQSLQWG